MTGFNCPFPTNTSSTTNLSSCFNSITTYSTYILSLVTSFIIPILVFTAHIFKSNKRWMIEKRKYYMIVFGTLAPISIILMFSTIFPTVLTANQTINGLTALHQNLLNIINEGEYLLTISELQRDIDYMSSLVYAFQTFDGNVEQLIDKVRIIYKHYIYVIVIFMVLFIDISLYVGATLFTVYRKKFKNDILEKILYFATLPMFIMATYIVPLTLFFNDARGELIVWSQNKSAIFNGYLTDDCDTSLGIFKDGFSDFVDDICQEVSEETCNHLKNYDISIAPIKDCERLFVYIRSLFSLKDFTLIFVFYLIACIMLLLLTFWVCFVIIAPMPEFKEPEPTEPSSQE